MVMDPVVGDPVLAPMRRPLVVAGRPNIVVGVVAMISGLPYISLSRRWAAPFVHRRGWPDANHDLRKRCRRDQGKSEQQCQCNFLHENRVLPGLELSDYRAGSKHCGNAHCAARSSRAHCGPQPHPLYHPGFSHDVPDCSVKHLRNKKPSIFRHKESGGCNPRSLFS